MRNGTPGAREKKSRDPPHPLSRDNLRPVSISARHINWLSRPCSEEEISDRVSRYTYIIQVKEFAAVRWRVIDGRDYILFFCLPARSLSVNNCSRRGDTVSLPRLRIIELRNWKFEKRRRRIFGPLPRVCTRGLQLFGLLIMQRPRAWNFRKTTRDGLGYFNLKFIVTLTTRCECHASTRVWVPFLYRIFRFLAEAIVVGDV